MNHGMHINLRQVSEAGGNPDADKNWCANEAAQDMQTVSAAGQTAIEEEGL